MDRRIVLVLFVVVLLGLALSTYLLVTRSPSSEDKGAETSAGAVASGGATVRPGDLEQKPSSEGRGSSARDDRAAPTTARGGLLPTNEGGLRVPPLPLQRAGDEEQVDGEEIAGTAANPYPVSRDGIRAAVQDRTPEIKECYDGWLALNPELEGSLIVSFGIVSGEDELAHIEDVGLASSELNHEFMQGCVLNVFEELAFQPPEGGSITVTYPLLFSSEPDED
jgi:hypothetical protein